MTDEREGREEHVLIEKLRAERESWLGAHTAEVRQLRERAERAEGLAEGLLEAMGDAMLSLATGPLREGHAYSVLEAALARYDEAQKEADGWTSRTSPHRQNRR